MVSESASGVASPPARFSYVASLWSSSEFWSNVKQDVGGVGAHGPCAWVGMKGTTCLGNRSETRTGPEGCQYSKYFQSGFGPDSDRNLTIYR